MDNNKYLEKITQIFDTHEKWVAFLELNGCKEQIINSWYDNLNKIIRERIKNEININNFWSEKYWHPKCFGYYIKSYGQGSLILLYERNSFSLYSDLHYKLNDRRDKLSETILFNSFFDNAEVIKYGPYLVTKSDIININEYNNVDIIAWFAQKNSKEIESFSEKVIQIFKYFMCNSEIITKIEEINEIINNQ